MVFVIAFYAKTINLLQAINLFVQKLSRLFPRVFNSVSRSIEGNHNWLRESLWRLLPLNYYPHFLNFQFLKFSSFVISTEYYLYDVASLYKDGISM